MSFLFQPSYIFLYIILTVGLLTASTDFWQKKIYNIHLILGAGLGLIAAWYTLLITPKIIISHLADGGLALLIGWLLYHFNLWRGGDAKLFVLYAFLMPPLEHGTSLFSGTIRLFACSFIAGVIILMPLFIKDIASNYNTVIDKLLSPQKRKTLFAAIRITIFFSWILFPVYHFALIVHIPAIYLAITYLVFYLSQRFLIKIRANYIIIGSGITFGFLMRLWLNPHSLYWPVLPYSILKIGLFSALSACIYATLDLFKEHHDRVPFAPLLFTGCVLSYTPFLTWIMRLVQR